MRACKLQPGSCMHAHSACGAERHEAVGANRIANRTAAAWFGPRSRSSRHLPERMARTPVRTCSPPNSSKHRGPGQKSAATCSVFHGNPRPRRRLLCSAVRVYPLYHTYAGRVPAPHCTIITERSSGRGRKGREGSLGGGLLLRAAARSRASPRHSRFPLRLASPTPHHPFLSLLLA